MPSEKGCRVPVVRCRGAVCPSRRNAVDPYRLPAKTHHPIASVAAVTAQPLAALPPYGCGVPFTGGERHWQLQIPAHSADRTGSRNCHCEGALRPWQSREGSYVFADSFPTIRPGTARLPRRPVASSQSSRFLNTTINENVVYWERASVRCHLGLRARLAIWDSLCSEPQIVSRIGIEGCTAM